MSGFDPEVADTIGAAFRSQGFLPMSGGQPSGRQVSGGAGGRPGDMAFDGPLKPGDAIGVAFVTGDLELGATGTVTHIDNDRVYAFGHPMYNLGPTEFPMTRAYVYTVLPSLFSSSKLSSTGDVIGTFLQDRATAIAGKLGPGPRMLPVTLTLHPERGGNRTFSFAVVRDPMFTPLMTYTALVNTIGSYEREFGAATFGVEGQLRVKNHEPIAFRNLFSGNGASSSSAGYVVAALTALIGNDYEDIELESLALKMTATEEPRTATLERVWIDEQKARAGRTVALKVLLRTYRGEDVLQTIPIAIPANASGNLAVMVSDGQRLTQSEQRESRTSQPRSVPQLVRSLNKVRRNDTLYVKLLGAESGAVVSGEVLSSLPPSVLAVLESDRSGGSFNPLGNATLGEWQLTTEHVVSGVRTLAIQVSPN
jgi:hypothetical protein